MTTRHVEHVMGMPVTIAGRRGLPAAALDPALALLHDVDAMFSTYKPDSEISRLDRGDVSADECSAAVVEVLHACERLRVETGGYFDPWLEAPSAGVSAARRSGGVHLDPSGYVKGWAVERCAAVLAGAGVTDYAVNAGGDIVARAAGGEAPWRIGIRHPDRSHEVVAVIAARRLAVATSASYARGDHIVDPHTGTAPAGVRSLTVTGPSLARADAYATAAYAMGGDGPGWVAARHGYGVFAITGDDRAVSDDDFDGHRVR